MLNKEKSCKGRCPNCGSKNINYGTLDLINNGIVYPIACVDCGCNGLEEYKLVYNISTFNSGGKVI